MDDKRTQNTIPRRLVGRRPQPMALEQRFVFDGAGAVDVADTLAAPAVAEPAPAVVEQPVVAVEVESALAPESQPVVAGRADAPELFKASADHQILNEATQKASEQIREYLAQASDAQLFELFRGEQTSPSEQWTAELARLRTSIADGSLDVTVSLLDNAQIKGALAAYTPQGPDGAPVIFVNRDWLSVMDAQQVSRLLVEEYGHHIDHLLNQGVDTVGDEGQRFAAEVNGDDTGGLGFAADDDHATLALEGGSVDVEFATLTFTNAYKVNTATTPAGKESNSHDYVNTSLGQVTVTDATNSRFFSGNDVSATALTIGTDTYYGWISRPIKSNGVVRGFYFWTDTDFTSLAAAQADGNQDGDSNVADNQGFLLVVDQAWFESVGWKNQSANLKNVGSSSDRVDAALNSFVGAPVAPVAVADNANGEANLAGGAAVEAGSGSAGTPAFGNVLTNDNSGDSKVVKAVGTSSASKPVNALTSSANGTVVVGLFGTLTLGADGSYRYVVNDANPQIEALRSASDTLVDSFTYSMADTAGATATTTLNVTIRGANDAPEASDDYNTAKESIATSDQYGLSDSTGSQATGNVLTNDLDLDRGDTKTIVGSSLSGYASALTEGSSTTTVNLTASTGAISANDYVFLKNSNGTLTPLKDSSGNVVRVDRVVSSQIYLSDSAAVSALPSGSTLLFSNKADGTGAAKTATLQSVTTTITASTALAISSNSGNIAEGMTVTGSGIESGTLVSSVNYGSDGKIIGVTLSKSVALATTTSLSFSNSATAGTSLTGQYGTLQLNANGGYIYTPTANNPALSEGKSAFEQFRYTMRDASGVSREATLYIAVAGSDTKDPNAVNDDALATEAGGTANGAAGQNPSGGNLLANDTNSSNAVVSARTAGDETSTTVDTNTQLVGLYGTLTLSSDGSYTYLADNSNATVQALRDTSTTLTDTFIYTVENGQVATDVRLQDSATLTITIRGANDAPVATDAEAAATEAGGVNNGTAGYNPSGNVLNAVTDVDDIRSELRVTAVRTGGVEGSGSAGTVGSALAGQYGSLTLNADGSWTYTVNNNNATVQALNPGETLTERFNYTVTDRSGTGLSDMAVLTLTIDGAADTVAVNSVFVNEASPYAVFTVSGSAGVAVNLSLSDSVGLPASDARATLGSDLGSALEYYDGSAWVGYTPGSQVVIPSGDKLLVRVAINQDNVHEGNESFTLTATASVGSSIGIGTINDEGEGDVYLPGNRTGAPDVPGSNGSPVPDDDRPTIAISSVSVNEGETAEFVVSLDKPSSTAISFSPNLVTDTATIDVDTAPAAQLQRFNGTNWVTVSGPVSIGPGEVSVRLRIATMDDSLVESDESFTLQTGAISGTVTNPGGAAGIATVRDNDMPLTANSEPVAFNDTLTATEDTPVTYTASQLLGNDSDADGSQLTIASVTSGTGGTAVLNSDGTVTFTPNANFNGVATFSYTVTDGSLSSNVATVTVNIGAANDAAVIGGNATGTVTEDFIVKGQGNLSAGGVLTVTDGDTGEASFVGTVTPSTGALGTLTISPTGEWAYNVPNSAVQYLKAGETRVEMFTVRTLDGTSQQVSVTIQGVNDPAIFVPNGQDGYVQEDTQLVSEGQLSVTDADQGEATILVQTATRGQYGEFSIDASGRWGYVLDNDSPAVQALGTADTRTETFAVSARDGTRTAVTVVVRGLDEVSQPQAPAEPPPVVTAPPQPSAPAPVPSPTVPAPEAPPASIAAPFDSAVATRPTASMTASPITVAMQRMADPAQAFSSFAFTDLYTSSSGFTVVVIESPQPRLSLYRGVSDQYADAGTDTSFAVPYDAFAHSDPNERILLSAGLADGQSLPGWVRFDPQSGKFEIQAPDGYNGELMIKVMARDTQGREATVLFRFTVGERKAIERNGRAGLSEQLRQAGQRPIAALERAVEASKLADAPRGKQAG